MTLRIQRLEIPFQKGEQDATQSFGGPALSADVVASVVSSEVGDVRCLYADGETKQITPGETEHVLRHGQIRLAIRVQLIEPATVVGNVTVAVCSTAESLEALSPS